jgi:hypothetical protein
VTLGDRPSIQARQPVAALLRRPVPSGASPAVAPSTEGAER